MIQKIIGSILFAAVFPLLFFGATPGDKSPLAQYGTTCVLMDDGGTATATKIITTNLVGANAFAVTNPAAASGTIYCGWDSSVTSTTGTPVTVGSSLSVDVVCNPSINCPKLFCTTGSATLNQVTPNCTRFLQVK